MVESKPKAKGGGARAKAIPEVPASFSARLKRLEQIVRALEDEDLDLDKAIELFQEGVGGVKSARALLEEAELTVRSVVEAADGSIKGRDVD